LLSAGVEVRGRTAGPEGDAFQGSFIGVDADRLVIQGDEDGRLALPMDSVAGFEVRVGRRGHAGAGAVLGLIAGGATAIIGAAASGEGGGGGLAAIGIGIFGAGGALFGGLLGALIRTDVWEPCPLPLDPARLPLCDDAPSQKAVPAR
jgi:hypothetical protein